VARPRTLLGRTGLTLTFALGGFLLFTVAVTGYYVLVPVAKRGADDLAALMVLSAKTWVELPPQTRVDFEWELLESHQLMLTDADIELPLARHSNPYVRFLEQALKRRLGQTVHLHTSLQPDRWYWADLPVAGRTIRIGFARERIAGQVPVAVVLVAAAGMVMILLTSLVLVRRLIRPLARLSDATARVGRGELPEPLPETGPQELAALARAFNRMAEELGELMANRTTLLAGISHDLRTPITRLRLALELLPKGSEAELVEGMRRDLTEMDRLIGESLELAHGLDSQAVEELDLRELVDGLVADYRRAGSDIQWRPGEPCPVWVSAGALRRVLGNLVDNALRYGPDAPVEVICEPMPDRVRLRVLDRGPGIAPDQIDAVFQPFYRLETSRSRRTGGSGLGLAIARQLCQAQGWQLALRPREGGGLEAEVDVFTRES